MSDDQIRITIACPEAYISKANELAKCVGYSEADGNTFTTTTHKDASNNFYAVASGLVKPVFLTNAFQPLQEPEWEVDLEDAEEAQTILRHGDPEDAESCVADPDHIVAVVHDDPATALSLLQLIPLS